MTEKVLSKIDAHVCGIDELTDALVITCDAPDPKAGNGTHFYGFTTPDGAAAGFLQFQHGPRSEPGSTPGVTAQAVISALIHHFQSFQAGPFVCRENANVITRLQEALHWAQHRAIERKRRGVLGKNEP